MKKSLIMLVLISAVWSAQATCPSWPTASRFSFNSNGDQVTDKRTGLIWQRCSVGQNWTGSTCAATATVFGSHEDAMKWAQSANVGVGASGWRLPNIKELFSLADKGCLDPAIDSTAFPNVNPEASYWATTPSVASVALPPLRAFAVDFGDGNISPDRRTSYYVVRLVRDPS